MRVTVLLVALSLTAAAQDKLYPFAVDQDHLAGAPDFSHLNHPLGPADRVFVRDGHFYTVGADLKPNTADDQRIRLFGVNTAFGANFPEPQDAARIAKREVWHGQRLLGNCKRRHFAACQRSEPPREFDRSRAGGVRRIARHADYPVYRRRERPNDHADNPERQQVAPARPVMQLAGREHHRRRGPS